MIREELRFEDLGAIVEVESSGSTTRLTVRFDDPPPAAEQDDESREAA